MATTPTLKSPLSPNPFHLVGTCGATRTPDPPNPDKPGRFTLALPLSRQSWRQLPLYRAMYRIDPRPRGANVSLKEKRKTRQNFTLATSGN